MPKLVHGAGRTAGSGKQLTLDEAAQLELWPIQETLGVLTQKGNFEALVRVLPLNPNFDNGQKAALLPLKEELERMLQVTNEAIKNAKRNAR